MTIDYTEHYQLQEYLAQEPNIIPAPLLGAFDDGLLYAALMDRIAQPLADGSESPFSSRNPLSGHGQLLSQFVYMAKIIMHELNLTPSMTWVQWFRVLGIERAEADYPVINLVFTRSQIAIASNITVQIPTGTIITSVRDPSLWVTTSTTIEISGQDQTVSIPATLNVIGVIATDIDPSEFTVLPTFFSFIDSVKGTAILYPGQNEESLASMMLRARLQLQDISGSSTPRGIYNAAIATGAEKIAVLPGIQYGSPGKFADLVTVVVYPASMTTVVATHLADRIPAAMRLDVRAAEIIPIDGTISIRTTSTFSNAQALNAIANGCNPPYGKWGDSQYDVTIATVLENQASSIYAVPSLVLKNSVTRVPLVDLIIQPWNLLEVQNSVNFIWSH